VRPDFSALLYHAHTQLCAIGVGTLLEANGCGEALLRTGREERKRRVTWLEFNGIRTMKSYEA